MGHDLHAGRQLEVASVDGGALFSGAQVHFDELGQLHGQAFDLDLGHDVVDQALVVLDGRRILFTLEVQRHLLVQAGLFVHALEVHVQDLGLVGVVLHIAQQHFLDLAAQFHVQDGGVEGFLLQGVPQGIVIDFDRGGGGGSTKNDTGRATGDAQTAARTRTLLGALKSDELHD